MNHELRELADSPFRSTGARRVKVVLMDGDNLPMARGTAESSGVSGSGVFWPDCPMPGGDRLSSARFFTLAGGEKLEVTMLRLQPGCPPHYDFHVAPACV